MAESMRIAVIGKKFPFCGIVTYCREQVLALRERGHVVAFYYLHNEAIAATDEDALPYLLKTHMFTIPARDARTRLLENLRVFRPAVVHASMALGALDWQLPEICAAAGVPLVVTFHVALDHRPSFPSRVSSLVYRLYARTLRQCDRVIIFSDGQKQRLLGLGVPESTIAVVPNGVDVRRYTPGASAFKGEIGARRLVTYMGRLDPEKNVGKLLKAWRQLAPPADVRLVIMGDGVLGERLRATFADVPSVHWLGFVQDEARRIDVLRGSDVFVLPSSVEGLSLALLEAMACGAVPIATDVGADGEVIAGCGTIVDPQALAAELGPAIAAQLAAPDHELAALRARTRKRVQTRYAAERNVAALERLYLEVIRCRAAS
jgi:glycosyltransferase involved in cell wall biosynthesis